MRLEFVLENSSTKDHNLAAPTNSLSEQYWHITKHTQVAILKMIIYTKFKLHANVSHKALSSFSPTLEPGYRLILLTKKKCYAYNSPPLKHQNTDSSYNCNGSFAIMCLFQLISVILLVKLITYPRKKFQAVSFTLYRYIAA